MDALVVEDDDLMALNQALVTSEAAPAKERSKLLRQLGLEDWQSTGDDEGQDYAGG
ncbi:hypothetical protein QQF73_01380 [Marinobacter sp. M216]|uniref:CopG family transcriptional regulator n=1 Tax=Marinobacter albus TaxID=3030833 RepID=A0ABT7H7B9_9GAMM|nr:MULTISPECIES: hypothetical protein [unclassified Marinobacter]MBW7471463.1 hypothetical protein [Marinobacter sp. F4218]MDK9556259.1 hypothetical protein [Marinobacter sp. M216]